MPANDEVLVKVHATTVTRTDCGVRAGHPFFARAFTGLARPKRRIAGMELAGEVVAVGPAVTEFKVGDRIFGIKGGANAEYVCAPQTVPIASMPAGMSFEEAAAVCDGACTALSCLRGAGTLTGRSIVVYGASGSIGTAAVQWARYFGAHVTAVCSTKNLDLVRSLGADEVVDYTREDFTKNGRHLRRHLRRRRQALVQTLPPLPEAGRDLHRDGSRLHVARPGARSPDEVGRRQTREDRNSSLQEGGRPAAEGADRGEGSIAPSSIAATRWRR